MIDTSPAALRKLARTLYQEEDLSDHEDALLVLAAEKEAGGSPWRCRQQDDGPRPDAV